MKEGGCHMNVLVYLQPMALALGLTALVVFFWSIRNRQYEDMEGAARSHRQRHRTLNRCRSVTTQVSRDKCQDPGQSTDVFKMR
jgi:cbb3-type cytochrome oxidase maturation protein